MKSRIPHAFIRLATLGIAVAAAAGCGGRDEIRTYEVSVTTRDASARSTDGANNSLPTDAPDAILAALVPREKALWFFKLSGPTGEVEKHRATARALLASVAFEGRLPKWTTPDGWEEERGGQRRLATLRPKAGAGDVELVISPLPRPALPLGDLIVSNVGRWRRQLQLPPAPPARVADAMLEVPTRDGTAWVFFAAGKLNDDTPSNDGGKSTTDRTSREAASPDRRPSRTAAQERGRTPQAAGFAFDAPDTWQADSAGGMVRAAFIVRDAQESATLRVTRLRATAGPQISSLPANLARWRGQVGLPRAREGDAAGAFDETRVDGAAGHYLAIDGPADAQPRRAMRVVMVERGGDIWFFKLVGDWAVVGKETDRFRAFIDSVRFDGEPKESGGN